MSYELARQISYRSRDQSGNVAIRFRDPVHGTSVRSDMPPPFIIEDARLHRGFTLLQRAGGVLSVNFRLAAHENAEDFGPAGDFEQKVKDCDVYVPEQFGYDGDPQSVVSNLRLRAMADPRATRMLIDSHTEPKALSRRVLHAIVNSACTVAAIDVPKKEANPVASVISELLSPDAIEAFGKGASRQSLAYASFVAGQVFREWYMVGELGAVVHDAATNRTVVGEKLYKGEPVNVLVSIGAGHYSLPEKFGSLGVPYSIERFPRQQETMSVFDSIQNAAIRL